MSLQRGDDFVALPQLSPRGEPGAGEAGMDIGRIRSSGCLEHELVHARELAQDEVEAVDDLQPALQSLVAES